MHLLPRSPSPARRPRRRWPISGAAAWNATPIGAVRLPSAVRLERNREDDCVGCHMPRSRSSDIIHAAATNHRIPRKRGRARSVPVPGREPRGKRRLVVNFHRDLMDERARAEAERDLGVAICRDGPQGAAVALAVARGGTGGPAGRRGRLGIQGVRARPARPGRGGAGRLPQGPGPGAEPGIRPDRGRAPRLARGRRRRPLAYWKRAIAISPWRSDYHAELAPVYFQARDWQAAAEACRETLRLNPANLEVRKLLVRCYLRLNDHEAARREFQTLLGFDPPDRDELIRWFAPLAGAR